MNSSLAATLSELMPNAIAWVEQCAFEISAVGEPLNELGLSIARQVGVRHPERIRIKYVENIPLPEDSSLREVALQVGLFGEGMVGVTMGHGIYICNGHGNIQLLSHECRHVHQYEQAGSIATFIPVYLQQIIEHGYHAAPFEVDARAHEIRSTRSEP